MKDYWEKRFQAEGKIWGSSPSSTAQLALELFQQSNVKRLLVPGSGYGRNTRLFSGSGFDVTGIEISPTACNMARKFDPLSRIYCASVLDTSFDTNTYDAVYCYNVLHFFREKERREFARRYMEKVVDKGILYFTVFSDKEPSYGKGAEVETNTFESKPGRPVHYFTEDDLKAYFRDGEIIESGMVEDPENHGEGPHIHILRYIVVRVNR